MKKAYLICLVALVIGGIALTCGCSTAETDSGSSDDQTVATTAVTTQQTTSVERTPVSYTILKTYLPSTTSNWVAEEPLGMSTTESGTSYSIAVCTYEHKTDADIMVTVYIQDTGGEDVGYWQMWDTFYAFDSDEVSWESTIVDLYPAWIYHDKVNDQWSEYVGLPNGIIVMVLVENGKEDYITVFNNQIDFRGMAAL